MTDFETIRRRRRLARSQPDGLFVVRAISGTLLMIALAIAFGR